MSGLALNSSVLTDETNITFRHRWFNSPGSLSHHRNVQTEASISSTYIPAAPTAARRHLLGIIQASLTLQYRHGVSTSSMTPISWHSPPKRLHARPCPNSCSTFVRHNTTASHAQF